MVGLLEALIIVTGLTNSPLNLELTQLQPPQKKTAQYCINWASADRYLQLKNQQLICLENGEIINAEGDASNQLNGFL